MKELLGKKANWGTAPVFLTAVATIFGAIMFLRFGYSVAHLGFLGTLVVIMVGHMVTIPTAMALAEVATNQKVEGGGEYFIISRSFGLTIGGAVGLALFLSQAISVAFYIVALVQAFDPAIGFIRDHYGWELVDKRFISLPALGFLALIMLTKGADLGMKTLYIVVSLLGLSLIMFFLGSTEYVPVEGLAKYTDTVVDPDDFFLVFAICFPAFTGMTAGVGLSGDLRDPKKSIPMGTLSATILGMVVYVFIAYKLALSASPEDLAADQLFMAKIALWGPIILIGLAAATISSALGSIMVAPRTLQAIAGDGILPHSKVNHWLARGRGVNREPANASIVVVVIAGIFLLIGDVDFVAQIISMFFMVTYGSICLISFLQHFAADPSYRPTFKSRWYISLFGALLCAFLMLKMHTGYAVLAMILMALTYLGISTQMHERRGLAQLLQGAVFQLSRRLHIFLQKSKNDDKVGWRPSVVCISGDSFKRTGAFELLRWISDRYGFGTYIHLIEDYLSRESHDRACKDLERLVQMAHLSDAGFYIDTMVSPSTTSAIAQAIQLPGISGKENNMILFEFARNDEAAAAKIVDNFPLVHAADFDVCILSTSEKGFGYRNQIHIWLTSRDFENANLMILLAFIILGHKDWRRGIIKLFAVIPEKNMDDQRASLLELIKSGRLPIAANNVRVIAQTPEMNTSDIIMENSAEADLTIIGFRAEAVKARGNSLFLNYQTLGNILFVNSVHEKEII